MLRMKREQWDDVIGTNLTGEVFFFFFFLLGGLRVSREKE